MSAKEVYIKRLEKLRESQDSLLQLSDNLESKFESFRTLTTGYSDRIKKHGIKRIAWYIKRWLRCFIGMKDEVMVLISGEIIRSYHEESHKRFIHDRGSENNIYKRSKILSLCSVDGIDYEYRMMVEKYGEKSALTRILDIHEPLGERLNRLSKRFDELVKVIHDAVNSWSPAKCQLDILHPAEKFLIIFGEDTILDEKGSRFRKCSKLQALSTTIEDPEDIATAPVVTKQVAANKRNRSAFNFEDEEEDNPASKASKVVDFHMDVSLDDIKRAAGVSAELLAKPTAADYILAEELEVDLAQETEQTDADKALATSKTDNNVLFQRSFLPAYSWSYLLSKRVMRFRLIDAQSSGTSNGSISTHSTTSFLATTVSQSSSLSNPTERIIPVVITACDIYLEEKERIKWLPYLSASDILKEITTYLWYGLTPVRQELPAETADHTAPSVVPREDRTHRSDVFQPFLPIAVQIENVQYRLDGTIPLPSEERPKKYPVICESCPAVVELMRTLQQWVMSPTHTTASGTSAGHVANGSSSADTNTHTLAIDRWKKQDMLVYNMSTIRYVADKLSQTFSLMQGSCSSDISTLNFVEIDSTCMAIDFDIRRIVTIDELQLQRKYVCDIMHILCNSFALYASFCLFVYKQAWSSSSVTTLDVHNDVLLLPFRYFPRVRCVGCSLANIRCMSHSSPLVPSTTGGSTAWKLQTLDLLDELSLFGYLHFSYSENVRRWHDIIMLLCANDGTVLTTSLTETLVASLMQVSTVSSSPRPVISALEWTRLFRGFSIANLAETPKEKLLGDPWIQFCVHMGRSSHDLQEITVPLAGLSSFSYTSPWLAWLVCAVGLAMLMDSMRTKRERTTSDRLEIVFDEYLLRQYPDVVPTIAEYLTQSAAYSGIYLIIKYRNGIPSSSLSAFPLVPFQL